MSRKTPLSSIVGSQSKNDSISRTIEDSCEIHESPGRKPDWHYKKLVSMEMIKKLFKMILSYILATIGRMLIDL